MDGVVEVFRGCGSAQNGFEGWEVVGEEIGVFMGVDELDRVSDLCG